MFGSLGLPEIIIIVIIIAILFGGKKLPELGRGLGQGISEFKNSLKGHSDKSKEEKNVEKASSDIKGN